MIRRLALGVVTLSIVLSGCGGLDASEETLIPVQAGELPVLTVGSEVYLPPKDRSDPIDIGGSDLSDKPLNIQETRGQVTVVNFWATWCPPCREEMPVFARAAQALADDDVTFVGVNVEDDRDAARTFAANVPFRSIIDADGRLLPRIEGVPPKSLPITLILDRQGRIATRVIGPIQEATFTQLVQRVLAEDQA
jgi:thiol-disulfide isomerase/thioredoxin